MSNPAMEPRGCGKKDENGNVHWTYSETITAENHEGNDLYMDEGMRESFKTEDGYIGAVYLEYDGSITEGTESKLKITDLEDFVVTAPSRKTQIDHEFTTPVPRPSRS